MSILTDFVFPFLAIIFPLVIVHELGHYLAARSIHVKVTDFAIGMGPRLASFVDRAGCRWQIRALPVGGYVRMLGDADAASRPTDADKLDAADTDHDRSLHNRPVLQRTWVIVAGPLANFVFGIAMITAILALNGRTYTPPVISDVAAESPAEVGGLKPGDKVISVNGRKVERFEQIRSIVAQNPGKPLEFTVERVDGTTALTVIPKSVEMESIFGKWESAGWVGMAASGQITEQVGLGEAFVLGVHDAFWMSVSMLEALRDIVFGVRSIEDLSGPVGIAEVSGNAVNSGALAVMLLLALLSLNLGIVNLIPLPVLDGGHLAFMAVEAIRGRPLSARAMMWAHGFGMAVILALFITMTYYDIVSLLVRAGILAS